MTKSQNQVIETDLYFKWTDQHFDPVIKSHPLFEMKSHKKQSEENWPCVEKILELAFLEKIPSNYIWDLRQVPEDYLNHWLLAASIYKRGVRILDKSPYKNPAVWTHSKFYAPAQTNITEVDPKVFSIGLYLEQYTSGSFYIIDANLLRFWPKLKNLDPYVYEASENNKNLNQALKIKKHWSNLSQAKRDKNQWTIIGGGVTCDLASFAASLCNCSVNLVPTTLLSMIDASIGGKTGVNHPTAGKNQIGRYNHPSEIFIWSPFLRTLSKRQITNGLAEALKHFFLAHPLNSAEKPAFKLSLENESSLNTLISQSIEFKNKVVSSDPYEKNMRKILNLGHTLGHAIETLSQQNKLQNTAESYPSTILHGEAVAFGLIFDFAANYYRSYLDFKQLQDAVAITLLQNFPLSLYELQSFSGYSNLSTLKNLLFKLACFDKKARSKQGNQLPVVRIHPELNLHERLKMYEKIDSCFYISRKEYEDIWNTFTELLPKT